MGSVNIMGNSKTLKILRGEDKIKYVAVHLTPGLKSQRSVPLQPYDSFLSLRFYQSLHCRS
jgi:hypothetical protein